jgi:hypothetical protein
MSNDRLKLNPEQFPLRAVAQNVTDYAEPEANKSKILYASEGIISAVKKPKSKMRAVRDFIRLPEKTVVEEREAVLRLIQQEIKHHEQSFRYEIDDTISEKLFSHKKYRDVKVSDLAALMNDIEKKASGRPDLVGKQGFSDDQWERILKNTAAALGKDGVKGAENIKSKVKKVLLLRRCKNIFDKVKDRASVKKLGLVVFVGLAFTGFTYMFPGTGVGIGLTLGSGAAFYRYITSKENKSEYKQIKDLEKKLIAAWKPEFAKDTDSTLRPYRNRLLASDGARFSAHLRQGLFPGDRPVNDPVLCSAINNAFSHLAAEYADVAFEERKDKKAEWKLVFRENSKDKYIFHSRAGSGDRVIDTYQRMDTGIVAGAKEKIPGLSEARKGKPLDYKERADVVIVRRPDQLSREAAEVRPLNNRVLAQAEILERPPFSETFNGRSLTGYHGMARLDGGYIVQVFDDYRQWQTIPRIQEILDWASAKGGKEEEWVRNIRELLLIDAIKVSERFADTSVPPGAFAVDLQGNLRFTLAPWLDGDSDMFEANGGPGEAELGLKKALSVFNELPHIAKQNGEAQPELELRLTRNREDIRDHLAKLINEYQSQKKKEPLVRTIENEDLTLTVTEPRPSKSRKGVKRIKHTITKKVIKPTKEAVRQPFDDFEAKKAARREKEAARQAPQASSPTEPKKNFGGKVLGLFRKKPSAK